MVDFIVPPPPNKEEDLAFIVPPPPVIDDFNGGINTVLEQFENTQPQYAPSSEKLSEAELRKDPEWIRAAKSIYEWNEARSGTIGGTQKVKPLNSDKEYADYALRYMGWFNYNIPKMANEATDLKTTANQQQREDFVRLMDMYDNKKISGAGTVRLIKGLALDPSTYVGIGTFGAGLAGREAAKTAAKAGIRSLIKQGAKQGTKVGAIEGAAYSTADNAFRQSARIMSGQREGFDLGESAKASAIGSVLGGSLGGLIGGAASYFKNKGNVVPNVTDEAEEFVVPPSQEVVETPVSPEVVTPKVDIKKQIDDELIKIGVDPVKVEGVPKLSAKQGFVSPELNNIPEDYGILGGRVSFKIDYDNPKNTANKLKEFFIEQNSLDNFKLVTPKVETPKRGTKIPEILKKPVKPKIRTARDYFGKVSDDADTELKEIFEDYKGNIQRKFKVTSQDDPNAAIKSIEELNDVQVKMQEDGFYNQLQTFDGENPSFRDDILEDLQNDTVHRDDQLLLSEWERKTEEAIELRKTLDDNNINYKGMSNEEVLVAYDDVVNNRIPPARDEVPLELYADDIEAASGGNINNVRVDDIVDPTPDGKDFQTDTTTGLNQRVIDVGMQIMDELEIPRNPNVRISDQLKEAVLLANSSPKFMTKFVDTLKNNNLTVEELSTVFKDSISDSARRMQQLSAAKQSMKRMGQELGEMAPDEGWYANFATQYTDIIRDLDNIRRGLLVSQIATAMRNNTAQVGRVGMNTLVQAFDDVLNRTFNPLRKAFGKETVPVDYTKSFGLLMNLTTNKKKAKELTEFLTKYYVNESDRLFTKYASEVADSSKSKVLKSGQKMVDGLNFLNRMQEFWYRRGMFATSIKDTLALKGIDINKVEINEDLLKHLKGADIEKAVDDALYFTYAKTPDNKFLKSFVDIANSIPFVTTGIFPFARFMANAIEFQFKHSPIGFGMMLRPKEIKKIAAGDTTAFSQAMIGSTLLLATIEAKRNGMSEDHKWYEVETSSGKTIDMRPYFPLTPYLFIADVITRIENGRNWGDPKDILQALTGAQFRAGASLQLVQNVLDGLGGLDTEEKINKFMSDYVSDVLGGFLTPLRMFNDFIEQEQDFRAPVPTGEFLTDTTNRLKTSIPIVREQFPELESPTREAAPGRPDTVGIPFTDIQAPGPLVRQLTGATVREEKNAAEREFDRLGFKRRDILPYSGNAVVDQTRAKYLGPLVEKVIPVIIQSEQYQSASNELKSTILRKTLTEIRSAANDYIKENRINEEQFAKAAFNRQPKYIKALLNSKGITSETFLQDYDTQIGANR
jgi:hypothetical protein